MGLDIAISHDRLLRRKHGQVQRTEDSRDIPEITTAWMEMRLVRV